MSRYYYDCDYFLFDFHFIIFMLQHVIAHYLQVIRDMFAVLKNRYIYSEEFQITIERLQKTALQHKIDKDSPDVTIHLPDSRDFEHSSKNEPKNKFHEWILQMVIEVSRDIQNISTDESRPENPYFAESLEKDLVSILSKLPLCGNIMNIPMGSSILVPTSSSTENDFDIIKNDLFNGSHGIRVDTFVEKHIVFTKGRMIGQRVSELRSCLFDDQSDDVLFQNSDLPTTQNESSDQLMEERPVKGIDTSSKSSLSESADVSSGSVLSAPADTSLESMLNEKCNDYSGISEVDDIPLNGTIGGLESPFENSKEVSLNREQISQNLDSSSSLDLDQYDSKLDKVESFMGYNEDGPQKDRKLHRSQTTILNPVLGPNQVVRMFPNSHISTVGIPRYVTENTCGFNALFSIYAVAYVDWPSFKSHINQSITPGSFEELIAFSFTEKESVLLNQRNLLLHALYKGTHLEKKVTNREIVIDCKCGFDFLNRKLNEICDQVHSVDESLFCVSCQSEKCQKLLRFLPIDDNNLNVGKIQSSLRTMRPSQNTCEDCGSLLSKKWKANNIVVIDIDNPVAFTNNLPLPTVAIDSIAQKFTFDGEEYQLHAVLCYRDSDEHFYAKIRRQNGGWQRYDDLVRRATPARTRDVDTVSALFYIKCNSLHRSHS